MATPPAGRRGRGAPAGSATGQGAAAGGQAGPGARPAGGPSTGTRAASTEQPQEIEYLDPNGVRHHVVVQPRQEEPTVRPRGAADTGRVGASRGPLRSRDVVDLATGTPYVLKWLPSSAVAEAGADDPYEQFDNEVQIGLRLARSLTAGGARYPRELSRLIGYRDTGDRPVMLWAEQGEPVERYVQNLPRAEFFQVSLLRALSILEAVGVVHRTLYPMTVRWTGEHVQIADFRNARLAGEPCRPAPSWLWSAPEAREAETVADPAEDLWSAGLVIVHVLNGRLRTGDEMPPDLRNVSFPGLDQTLDGVFRRVPWDRPSIELIMAELGALEHFVVPGSFTDPLLNDRQFRKGLDDFARVSRTKETAGSGESWIGDDDEEPTSGGAGGPGEKSWLE